MTVHAKSKSSQQIEDSCKECREMVGMFMDEFRATDTGLYEGGDTAWEVKNLKDYRKSELRLIEITDKMFKSKKDKISRMLEKVCRHVEVILSRQNLLGCQKPFVDRTYRYIKQGCSCVFC